MVTLGGCLAREVTEPGRMEAQGLAAIDKGDRVGVVPFGDQLAAIGKKRRLYRQIDPDCRLAYGGGVVGGGNGLRVIQT